MRRLLFWLFTICSSVDSLIIVGGPGAIVLSRSECDVVGAWRAAVDSSERIVGNIALRDCFEQDALLGAGIAMYALPALFRDSPTSTVVHVLTDPFSYAPTRAETHLFKSTNPLVVWCFANLKIERDARVAGVRYLVSSPQTQRRYGYSLARTPPGPRGEEPYESPVVSICLSRFGATKGRDVSHTALAG